MSRKLCAGFAGVCGVVALAAPAYASAQTDVDLSSLKLKQNYSSQTSYPVVQDQIDNDNGRWKLKPETGSWTRSILNPPQQALGNYPTDVNPVIILRSRDYKLAKDVKFSLQLESQKKGGGWLEEAVSSKSIPFSSDGEGKWGMKGIKKGVSITFKYEFRPH